MFDIYITVLAAVAYVIFFANCSYFLMYFSHEDDNNSAYLPKVVVVLGLTTAATFIFLFPIDVMNRDSKKNGIPMDILFFSVLSTIILLTFLLIPFAYFYYSEWDPDKPKRALKFAIIGCLACSILFGALTALSYIFLNNVSIDYDIQTSDLVAGSRQPDTTPCQECNWKARSTSLSVKTSFLIQMLNIMCFFGTILFSVFCGIGLITAPYDFFNAWYKRPEKINNKKFEELKVVIGKRADDLISKAVKFNKKPPKTKVYNEWRKEVYLLEEDWERTVEAHKPDGIRVLWYWFCLFVGVIGALLSISIILNLILSRLLDVTMFLNVIFVNISGFQNILGVIVFILYAVWLQVCVINGNLNFGIHVPFFFSIHPMKASGTLMNSFLFNTGLICMSSVALTKFCVVNFYEYVHDTYTYTIFNVTIENLKIFKYVWIVCDWAIVGLSLLTVLILLIKSCCGK